MSWSRLRQESGWLLATLVATVQLRLDFLAILDPLYKAAFQSDSDALVINRLNDPGAGLGAALASPEGGPYISQLGLQGIVMGLVSPGVGGPIGLYRWTSCLLLAAVLVLASRALAKRVSVAAGVVLLVLLLLAPWLNAFAPSLYWQVWVLLLPTLVPLLLWPRVRARSRPLGWVLVAGLVMFKALNGYEFITTVILGATAAVCFHEFRGKVDLRLIRVAATSVVVGIVGFGAALLVHTAQLSLLYGQTTGLRGRSEVRTFAPDNLETQVVQVRMVDGPFVSWLLDVNEALGVWVYRLQGYLFDTAVATPNGAGLGPSFRFPVWVFVAVYVALLVMRLRGRASGPNGTSTAGADLESRLLLAAGIGLLGAMSWLVLAYGHMINHAHIDAIVFYLPFLPFVFAVLALRTQAWWSRRQVTG